MKPTTIIMPTALLAMLSDKDLVLIEAGNNAYDSYLEEHLANTIYLELNEHLSAQVVNAANGGRHPLPSVDAFSSVIAACGITSGSKIVIYDRNFGANAAARLWWMFMSAGVRNVRVVNGGFLAAKKAGFPLNTGVENPVTPSSFRFTEWHWPVTTINEVKGASEAEKTIIDVRDKNRYDGLTEPLDPIAGHIPNAINIPFKNNLDEDGMFLTLERLKSVYANVYANGDVIVQCGSGVTACHTILAMVHAGFEVPQLYVGSWSEWCRSGNKMISNTSV